MLIHQEIVPKTLLVLYFLLSYDGVQGEIKLSKLENSEFDKQLKLLNKPPVKIIKTNYGDTYDCVDFYKQPAFDHPLLKNHNFYPQMKPTLARTLQKSNSSAADKSLRIWLNGRGCPFGTVLIKRISKDDLIRQRYLPPPEIITAEAQLTSTNNNSELTKSDKSSQGYKLAIVKIPYNSNNKFGGARMSASLWNPHIEGQQNIACRLKVQKGSDALQAGWRVDPTLYKDSKTRFFIHFQAGNTHCFNILCPGFVLRSSKIPVDMAFDKVQHRGDKNIWEISMHIVRDLFNGNWWILIGESEELLGFWPQKIFTNLASYANNVEWGGVAYSPRGVFEPPLGSGCFPIAGNPMWDAYCGKLDVLSSIGETIHVEKTNVRVDDRNLYGVMDVPHWGSGKFTHLAFYGGPGGFKKLC